MMQNPDQDRVTSVKKMTEVIGVTYHSMEIVRGDYDVVGILEGDYEPVAGMKVAVMQSGMMDELISLIQHLILMQQLIKLKQLLNIILKQLIKYLTRRK